MKHSFHLIAIQRGRFEDHFLVRAVRSISFLIVFIASINTTSSHAETYFGVFGGYEFDPKPTNLTAMEDEGYSTSTANLHASKSSDLQLKQSPVGGMKLGAFLDSQPDIGFEISAMYSRPDMKRQNVTITIIDGSNFAGFDTFVEDQLPADFNFITTQASLIYRFMNFDHIRPYVGIGPVAYIVFIHGDGRSGKLVSPFVAPGYNNGTLGDGFGKGLGISGKVGLEYLIDKNWSLDFEYQISKGSINIDHFRSFSDMKVDFSDQIFTTGLRYRF